MYGPFGRHKIKKLVSHLATDSKCAWKYLALRSREITCRHNVIHMMWTTWAETWKTGDTNKCVGKFAITDAAVWKCVCVCALAGKRNVDADFDVDVDNSKRIQFDACAFAPFFYSSHFPYHFPSLTFVDSLAHFFLPSSYIFTFMNAVIFPFFLNHVRLWHEIELANAHLKILITCLSLSLFMTK